jgi:hypothetical protein
MIKTQTDTNMVVEMRMANIMEILLAKALLLTSLKKLKKKSFWT